MTTIEIKACLEGISRVKTMEADAGSHHYISLNFLHAWMTEEALPAAKGVMLDYGCGGQPYKFLFMERVSKYIGADVAAAKDTILDLEIVPDKPVPLLDASVDTVLSTQTLEHVPNVEFYLAECHRLLKQDGVLILTAPMQWRHHEVPYDFFRFTKYGLTALLTRHGFTITNMTPCGGVYALIGQIFLNHLAERGIHNKSLYRLVNRLVLWLDKKYPDTEDTLNWMLIARKMGT